MYETIPIKKLKIELLPIKSAKYVIMEHTTKHSCKSLNHLPFLFLFQERWDKGPKPLQFRGWNKKENKKNSNRQHIGSDTCLLKKNNTSSLSEQHLYIPQQHSQKSHILTQSNFRNQILQETMTIKERYTTCNHKPYPTRAQQTPAW